MLALGTGLLCGLPRRSVVGERVRKARHLVRGRVRVRVRARVRVRGRGRARGRGRVRVRSRR